MKRNRFICVFLSLTNAVLLVYASNSLCEFFWNVKGYDRCQAIPLLSILPYVFISIIPSFVLPISPRVSSVVLLVVYLTHVMSGVIALAFMLENNIVNIFFAMFLVFSYSIVCILISTVSFKVKIIKINLQVFSALFVLFSIVIVLFINKYFPINFDLPSIYDVYGHRAVYKQTLSGLSNPFLGYFVIISGYSLAPIAILLFLIFLDNKKKILSLVFLFLALLLSLTSFSAAAFKSVAFVFIIVLVMALIMKRSQEPFGSFIKFVFFGIISIFLIGVFLDTSTVFVHWFRRAFSSPGRNLAFYFEYIDFWSMDGLKRAPLIISQFYYGTDGSANSGLYGDGLAVAGIVGILRNLLIFTFYLFTLDIVSRKIPLYLSSSLILPQAYALANSATLTVLITYGLATNILFLYLISFFFNSKIKFKEA